MQSALKLGIVYIGKAGGKHKYSLLDERDIPLVNRFRFEARVDIDRDGNGAKIYAYAFDLNKEKTGGCYFHEYVWERHCGGIAPGFRVAHKNCVTVDNRMQNLCLVPCGNKHKRFKADKEESVSCNSNQPREDQSLYWMAVSRLPPFEVQDEQFINSVYNKFYNSNGELVEEEDDSSSFYECHYPPCCKMESELRQFSICGRCQQVRYCGTQCQERDWPNHKKNCKEKAKKRRYESPPER